jgi:ketosteroid isomerase-like protein
MKIKKHWPACLAAVLLAAPALAQTIDRQAALDGLVAAEKAFSKKAGETTIHDAFVAFMAPDGVLFRPDPMNAQEFLSKQPARPGLLTWFPAYAEVSLAGDLGYDTGPAEYRDKAGDPPSRTQFATVWKKQADGSWKAMIDLGVTDVPPMPVAISLKGPAKVETSALPKADAKSLQESLILADGEFGKYASLFDVPKAYRHHLADDARLLREGRAMAVGKEAAVAVMSEEKGFLRWNPAGSGIAASGDLGYTYGIVERSERAPGGSDWVKIANYMRVWRTTPKHTWELAFEVLSPRPKPAPKPATPKPAEEKKPSGG